MIDAQQNLKIKIDNWPKMGLTTAPSPLPSQPSVGHVSLTAEKTMATMAAMADSS